MKHTPGPWAVQEADLGGLEFFIMPKDRPESKFAVCEGLIEHGTYTVEENRANARLIAAAPNLLANLEFAVKLLSPMMGATAQVEHMRKVIAQATVGEATSQEDK